MESQPTLLSAVRGFLFRGLSGFLGSFFHAITRDGGRNWHFSSSETCLFQATHFEHKCIVCSAGAYICTLAVTSVPFACHFGICAGLDSPGLEHADLVPDFPFWDKAGYLRARVCGRRALDIQLLCVALRKLVVRDGEFHWQAWKWMGAAVSWAPGVASKGVVPSACVKVEREGGVHAETELCFAAIRASME